MKFRTKVIFALFLAASTLAAGTALAGSAADPPVPEGPGAGWAFEIDYSWFDVTDEEFDDVFDDEYYPLSRLGFGWYPLPNFSTSIVAGGMYEVGEGDLIDEKGRFRRDSVQLYVLPLQYRLRYEFAFVEDQLVVPAVYAGGDFWYFQEIRARADNVSGHRTGWHGGAELDILLDLADPDADHRMLWAFGIRYTYLTVGYEYISVGEGEGGPEFTGQLWKAGVRFETGGP